MVRNCLEVHMFGKFELVFNGKPLHLGHNQTTKPMKLLQMLLFFGKEGIHRSQVIQYLFGIDAEGSLQTNLRVVVFNLRKILVQAGLPDENYIAIDSGVYRFEADFPIVLDVQEFEAFLQDAKAESGPERRKLLEMACNLYQGHLLPELSGEDWVIIHSARFQRLYSEGVEQLAEILKDLGEHEQVLKLCGHASNLYPFDEWQVYEMEAMLAMGDGNGALDLYEKTIAMYFDELAMPPSERMLECFEHMRESIQMGTSNMKEVQEILNEKDYVKGGFYCQYPSFVDSYRMMARMIERSGQSVFLLMCTIHDEKGKVTSDPELLKKTSDYLYEAIQESLRRSDVFTKYNLKQFLIMLPGIRKEECSIVTNRIDAAFRKRYSSRGVTVHYHTDSFVFQR